MAEDCISVKFDQEDNYWYYCWESTSPSPAWNYADINTGLRKGQGASSRAWRSCQYYLNGLASICTHWQGEEGGGACGYVSDNTSDNPNDPAADIPTGFNNSLCDNLGRRQWCDKYEGTTEENLDEWVCAAPNGYITGLGKRAEGKESPIVRLLDRSEILGYNDDGTGVGLCDCWGMGRGAAGCDITEENIVKNQPVVCNYYRPWSMGFGAVEPKTRVGYRGPVTEEEITEAIADIDVPLDYRLPLSVEFANHRAMFQKCNFWEEDYSSKFIMYDDAIILEDEAEGDPFDEDGRITFCTCTETVADGYNHRFIDPAWRPGSFLTDNVTALAGGLICNGASPECPCYSGKWIHCTTEKMSAGMPVTANQVLELRFWVADWESKKFYNEFFEQKPNFKDANTSDIYTFTRWNRDGAATPTMIGKRLNLCFPIPVQEKEFTRESIFVEAPITYAPAYIETGTDSSSQRHFPTLLRNDEFESIRLLTVAYPYFSDSDITADCNEDDGDPNLFAGSGHLKRHNNILGDSVTSFGQVVANKKVYLVNTTGFPVDPMIKQYSSMFTTPVGLQNYLTNKLMSVVFEALVAGTGYFATTTADSIFGIYVTPPVDLIYNTPNLMLIMVDYGDGQWEFRWRKVNSLWCGGIIKQTKFEHSYSAGDDNQMPLSISPPATASFKLEELNGCTGHQIRPSYSFETKDPLNPKRYFSYSIVTDEIDVTQIAGGSSKYSDLFWFAVNTSNMIGVEVNNLLISYVYDWEFVSGEFIPTEEKKKDLIKKGLPIDPIPIEEFLFDKNDPASIIDRHTLAPSLKLLRPVDSDKHRQRFSQKDWHLRIIYRYDKFINDDPTFTGYYDIKAGAGKTDEDLYTEAPYDVSDLDIDNISRGPVNLLAEFNDSDGRLIATMATKAATQIVRESCRNVEIFYSYSSGGRLYRLDPFTGFCILPTSESSMPGIQKHVEIPNCGDHDMSWDSWVGPNWFPFNSCRGYDMYNEFTVCNYCYAGYVGPKNSGMAVDSLGNPLLVGGGTVVKRYDYRYCGPYKYDAFGDTRGNFASACDCGCKFWYSDASVAAVTFDGYGKIRTAVNLKSFADSGFYPPPFGNDSRELVEKFVSQDYIDHIYVDSSGGVKTRSEWMPMVMDNAAFFMTFNAYDGDPETVYYGLSSGLDPLYYVNQMNFGLLTNVNEEINLTPATDELGDPINQEDERYRFDEIFEIHIENKCSHPEPAYPVAAGSSVTKVAFYYFKQQTKEDWLGTPVSSDITWAWQEYWNEIERKLSITEDQAMVAAEETAAEGVDVVDFSKELLENSTKLDFISRFERPKYIFGYYKDEHRLIAEEGHHYISYEPPALDEQGNILVNPTLSIDGVYPRSFEIIYGSTYSPDNYNSAQVTWLDQGGQSQTEASAAVDNMYEKADANDSEWLHDKNALFGTEASTLKSNAEDDGRVIITAVDDLTGDETKGYYNRGIIVHFPKDRLDFLPKDIKTFSYDLEGVFIEQGGGDDAEQITMVVTEEYEPDLSAEEPEPSVRGNYVWETATSFVYQDAELPINFYSIKIIGTWGDEVDVVAAKKIIYLKPGVSLSFTYQDGSTGPPRTVNSLPPEVAYYTAEADSTTQGGGLNNLHDYIIESQFLLGPIEMLKNRIIGFQIVLEGDSEPEEFISIESIELTTAEYSQGKVEHFQVWERKYRASKSDVGDFNLDQSDNLQSSTDQFNSGVYFPFKGLGEKSRPDEEIYCFNKTKVVAAGLYIREEESIEISYDNLHEVEKTAQKDLYEYAIEKDESGGSLTYSATMPYKVAQFLTDRGMKWEERSFIMESEVLPWEKHYTVQEFKQYDYWRPGGHKYEWDVDNIVKQKCTLFTGAENTLTALYKHIDHQGQGNPLSGAEEVVDPGHSYYALRTYAAEAKYDRAMILAGGDPEYSDKWSGNYLGTFLSGDN